MVEGYSDPLKKSRETYRKLMDRLDKYVEENPDSDIAKAVYNSRKAQERLERSSFRIRSYPKNPIY